MYFGPAKDVVAYFSGISTGIPKRMHSSGSSSHSYRAQSLLYVGIGFNCPSHFNPADFFIDLLSFDGSSDENLAKSKKRITYLHENYTSQLKDHTAVKANRDSVASNIVSGRKSRIGYPKELYVLLGRQFKAMSRERAGNIARIMQALVRICKAWSTARDLELSF